MTLPQLEKVDTAIVLLSAVEKTINVSAQDLGTIMREPAVAIAQAQGPGQAPMQGFQITSLRDQVVVSIMGGSFQFQDKSDTTPGTARLPEIVQGFLGLLQKQDVDRFRAYGINFDVAFDSRGDQPPSEILADRYLNREAFVQRGQISVRGAGLRLYFSHLDARCEMNIEPRFGQVDSPKFYAHINYNFDLADEKMPPPEELKTKYHGLWPQFSELLEKLLIRP